MAARPLSVSIVGLGGQGGGVLAGWLAEAARKAGHRAQVRSPKGPPQRGGSVRHAVDMFPEVHATGDIVIALEPTEAGLIGGGTTVITTRRRVFEFAEKVDPDKPPADARAVIEAIEGAAGSLTAVDAEGPVNAVLFGAMAASGALPLGEEHCRAAIRDLGPDVETNLAGFEAGLAAADGGAAGKDTPFDPSPECFAADMERFDNDLRPLVGHALARLADYQDAAYARLYLDRLGAVIEAGDPATAGEVARRLAAWMTYEDAIRIAQVKTRPGRLGRIRRDLGLPEDATLQVTDYLGPMGEALDGLLPSPLFRLLARPGKRLAGRARGIRVSTTSPLTFLALRLLAALKPWRRRTHRFAREQAVIGIWLEAVIATARRHPELARKAARAALWARGYGEIRERGLARLETLFATWNNRLEKEGEKLAAEVEEALAE